MAPAESRAPRHHRSKRLQPPAALPSSRNADLLTTSQAYAHGMPHRQHEVSQAPLSLPTWEPTDSSTQLSCSVSPDVPPEQGEKPPAPPLLTPFGARFTATRPAAQVPEPSDSIRSLSRAAAGAAPALLACSQKYQERSARPTARAAPRTPRTAPPERRQPRQQTHRAEEKGGRGGGPSPAAEPPARSPQEREALPGLFSPAARPGNGSGAVPGQPCSPCGGWRASSGSRRAAGSYDVTAAPGR